MRVLIVTSTFLPGIGGAEVAIHHLAEGLTALGHSVAVGVIQRRSGPEHERSYEVMRSTPPRGLGRTPFYASWVVRCVRRMIASWRPDLVHAHYAWPTGFAALRARPDPRLPVVLTSHGEDIQVRPEVGYGYRLRPGLDRRIRFAVQGADLLTAVGSDVREEYLRLGIESERVVGIPNGIAWKQLAAGCEGARRYLDLPSDRAVILAVGRNHPKKGFADLLQVLADLRRDHPEAMALIVGRDVRRLRSLSEELGVVDRVRLCDAARPAGIRFAGEGEDPARRVETYYHAADVYAMTSLVEAAGIVTMEAMAAGLAVVARQAPGTEDLVQPGVTGLLVGRERRDLASGISRLLRDAKLRQALGRAGKLRSREFDRETVAARYAEAYERAVRRGREPAAGLTRP